MVWAYVYDRVAKDSYSKQTPHYGFLDGDGDFIFKAPNIKKLIKHKKFDEDILISVPTPSAEVKPASLEDLTEKTKEYLSDSRYKIKLHDIFNQKLRQVASLLKDDKFKIQGVSYSNKEFFTRIKLYEDIVTELQVMTASVAYWGNRDDYQHLSRTLARLSDNIVPESGNVVLLSLRSYPIFLLVYSAGISALSANNYEALATIFTTKVQSPRSSYQMIEAAIAIGEASAELYDDFLKLPGHERQYTPRSEYLYKLLQPSLDDLLYLGRDYEEMFDRFEVLLALVYADLTYEPENNFWVPLGRFGWKYNSRGRTGNVFSELVKEAKTFKSEWAPLKAGLFSGSIDHFLEVSSKLEELLKRLNWF